MPSSFVMGVWIVWCAIAWPCAVASKPQLVGCGRKLQDLGGGNDRDSAGKEAKRDPNPTQCTELQLDTVPVRTCRLSLRDAPGEVHTPEPTARPAPGLDQLYYPFASPPLLATP